MTQQYLSIFRETKRRAELIAAKNGVMCLSGSQRERAVKTLEWWKKCDQLGWAAWCPAVMSQAQTNNCVSAPLSLINYWIEDTALRKGAPAQCPTQVLDGVSFRQELFGFNALKAEKARSLATSMFLTAVTKFEAPGTPDEVSAQAAEEAQEAAQAAEDQMDLGPSDNGPLVYRGEEMDEVGAPGNARMLMWGAVGLVAAGGIGYMLWKYVFGPKGMPANPASFTSRGVRAAIDPYGEGEWEEVWDPRVKAYVVAPFGGVPKTKGPQTKSEMRRLGYKYDLYTGEKL
jgi:hypothetical protein